MQSPALKFRRGRPAQLFNAGSRIKIQTGRHAEKLMQGYRQNEKGYLEFPTPQSKSKKVLPEKFPGLLQPEKKSGHGRPDPRSDFVRGKSILGFSTNKKKCTTLVVSSFWAPFPTFFFKNRKKQLCWASSRNSGATGGRSQKRRKVVEIFPQT